MRPIPARPSSFRLALLAGLALCLAPAAAEAASPRIAYEAIDLDAAPVVAGERMVRLAAVEPAAPAPASPVASFGPFRVLDAHTASLVDVTDSRSPAQFAALLRAYPGITELKLVECPGTEDDLANLQVGRMIRAHAIATHVPSDGSVRSGAVELFLAGSRRIADPGAEFAVHSWQDEDGKAPSDYPASAPENRRYLDYYRMMGMSPIEAEAFYAMTNSVPFETARWFGVAELSRWVVLDSSPLLQ